MAVRVLCALTQTIKDSMGVVTLDFGAKAGLVEVDLELRTGSISSCGSAVSWSKSLAVMVTPEVSIVMMFPA